MPHATKVMPILQENNEVIFPVGDAQKASLFIIPKGYTYLFFDA